MIWPCMYQLTTHSLSFSICKMDLTVVPWADDTINIQSASRSYISLASLRALWWRNSWRSNFLIFFKSLNLNKNIRTELAIHSNQARLHPVMAMLRTDPNWNPSKVAGALCTRRTVELRPNAFKPWDCLKANIK